MKTPPTLSLLLSFILTSLSLGTLTFPSCAVLAQQTPQPPNPPPQIDLSWWLDDRFTNEGKLLNPQAILDAAFPQINDSWIVILREGITTGPHLASLREFVSEYEKERVAKGQGEVRIGLLASPDRELFGAITGYSITVNDTVAAAIAQREDVLLVQPNQRFRSMSVQTGNNVEWNLRRISSPVPASYVQHNPVSIRSANATTASNFTYPTEAGQNIDIYILDTGITPTHPDFEGRASWGVSLTSNGTQEDANGHGTHVAGLAISKTYGVAKRARAIGIKVLDHLGLGSTETILQGLNYVLADGGGNVFKNRTQKRKMVLMSLGGAQDRAVDLAITKMVRGAQIPVVAPSGNLGAINGCQLSPGGSSSVFAVGASDQQDVWTRFSSFGPCLQVVAPGDNIDSLFFSSGRAPLTGTSMAAALAAGVMATVMSQAEFGNVTELYDAVLKLSKAGGRIASGAPEGTTNVVLFNGGEAGISYGSTSPPAPSGNSTSPIPSASTTSTPAISTTPAPSPPMTSTSPTTAAAAATASTTTAIAGAVASNIVKGILAPLIPILNEAGQRG
ncbi:hypothetical protein HDV05_004883 [Chytridiales sp. JEL 0842]|nr:hypothetical protein HDV05_004883 [Chytridiales sp. JEL 0842]